jgi:hypothetical protein
MEQDDVTLIISRERWENYIQPLIKNEQNIKLSKRPKEGDLIYFPLDDRLYEIKYIDYANPFYQLQKLYTYEMRCELFRYEDEVIDTGINNIDDSMQDAGYTETLTLLGVGVTATATATFVNGGLQFIRLLNDGFGYTSTPIVAISSASSGGFTATAVAITTSKVGLATQSSIKQVLLTNPGYGYTVPPSVVFVGGGGSGAATTVGIATTGGVGIITITNSGSGYSTTPTVTFSSPGAGITAIGEAVVSSSGTITAIRISNAGYGYTTSPIITISNPSMIGSGDFIYNEVVTGSISGTQGRVKVWNALDKTLKVSIADGTFTSGETITGSESGAVYTLQRSNTDDLLDTYAENDVIQSEADAILDFSQKNPFGEV